MKSIQTIVSTILLLVLWIASGNAVWQHTQSKTPAWLQHIGGDFTLQSADGIVSLADFRGKKVLLYFGYTHCPDACPLAMSVIANVLKSSNKDDVVGILISLDPRRDSPDLLKKYTAFFHPNIVGLTGNAANIQRIADNWRVAYHVPVAPADNTYTVDHSTFIYLINEQGKPIALVDEKTSLKKIQGFLRMR
ncbi:MAG: SCO family protein [Mariprofundaceae bacterium]|nr:SCO family protein [Mariprofundaceae bacterium]